MQQYVTSALQNVIDNASSKVEDCVFPWSTVDNSIIVDTSAPNNGAVASPSAIYADHCLKGLGRSGKLLGAVGM